jgi:hypothetical protein
MLRCVSSCSGVSDWTIRWFCSRYASDSGPAQRLNGRHKHLGGHFSHPVEQAAIHEAQCFEAQTKQRHRRASHAVRSGSKSGEGGHRKISEAGGRGRGEEKKHLNEILSGFVDNAVPSTKPDSSSGFARQIG